MTSVLAATSLTGTVTSQADLPYPTTTTCLPRASSTSCRSVAAQHPAAGRGELGLALVARHGGLAEHPVGDHELVEPSRSLPAGGPHVQPPSAGPAAVTSVRQAQRSIEPKRAAYAAR